MESRVLEAGDLCDDEPGFRDPNVDERLNLKAVTPQPSVAVGRRRRCGIQANKGRVPPPEGVEPVAEIRIVPAVAHIKKRGYEVVAKGAQAGDVAAAAALKKAGALGEVRAGEECLH